MTALALSAEVTGVNIIVAMTGVTLLGQLDLVLHYRLVTGPAGDLLVGAFQAIFGLSVMVELPEFPAVGVVALFALWPQSPLVDVFADMASVAVGFSASVISINMALLAWCGGMQASQGKARHIVVKGNFFAPTLLIVATLALLAFLALMHIDLLMALHAFGLSTFLGDIAGVA